MTPTPTPDRRVQVVEAALSLVREGGLDALSVRAVAARAGVGASTLRHYFPSQRDLNEAVAERLLVLQLDDYRIHDPAADPAERLIECLSQFLGEPDARLASWLDLVHGAVTRGPDSAQAQLLAGFSAATRDRVRGWLRQLAGEGHLPPSDVGSAATALLVRLDGLALAILTPGSEVDLATAHQLLTEDVAQLLGAWR